MRTIIGRCSIVLLFIQSLGPLLGQQYHIYLANDNHTDYFWSGNAQAYVKAALNEIDYYLDQADATHNLALPFQSRYNLDGAWYAYVYKNHRSAAQFERLINRIRSGHISMPYNFLVSTYGGQPTEAILRGMYWPGRQARKYDLNLSLVAAMENQTLPLGLASLWAGSGAKYSWKGVCGCSSPIAAALLQNRNHELYRYRGLDGAEVVMKWYSLSPNGNQRLGGYAEARNPIAAIAECEAKSNRAAYPYAITGAFGHGWDDLQTLTDIFVRTARERSNSSRQIYVSNEHDFFTHFKSAYGFNNLPVESVTYGNDWDMDCEALAAVTGQVRRSVEKLRAAEAMASLISLIDEDFYPAEDARREAAWVALGSYWEHNFGLGGCCNAERGVWQQELERQIRNYVDGLFESSLTALSNNIRNPAARSRFMAFNALGWVRTDYVKVRYDGGNRIKVVDLQTGRQAPHQILTRDGNRYLQILARDVPPVGYKVYEVLPEASGSEPNAATLQGNVFENSFYRLTVTSQGAIISLVDKRNGNRELVKKTGERFLNDFGQGDAGGGTLSLLYNGPVSATIACTSPTPLQHTTYITLYAAIDRIDIDNKITDEFGDEIRTYAYSFNFNDPTLWHEELGAILKVKSTAAGGHYAPRGQPIRHDWQTLNHFADIGTADRGVILSNQGAGFMKLGNSVENYLDENAAQINVLIGGRMKGSGPGFANQLGLTNFEHSFALRSREGEFNAAQSMKFALEHQNPFTAAFLKAGGGPLPEAAYSLLKISNPNVLLWALKPAEEESKNGALTLRVWNLDGNDQAVIADFTPQILAGTRATHLEINIETVGMSQGNLAAVIGRRKMETFRLFPDRSTLLGATEIRTTIHQTICEGAQFAGYSESGTYVDVFTAANGADSIRTLELTVIPTLNTTLNRTICGGRQFEGYSESGTYVDTFFAVSGCDSVRVLNLTVLPELQIGLGTVDATQSEPPNGSAAVMPAGGVPPYEIIWSNDQNGRQVEALAPGNYAVTVTDHYGCSKTEHFEIRLSNRLWDIQSLARFELYPNPAEQRLFLKLAFHRLEQGRIMLQDIRGSELYVQQFSGRRYETEFDLSRYGAGVYLVRLVVGDREASRLFVSQ